MRCDLTENIDMIKPCHDLRRRTLLSSVVVMVLIDLFRDLAERRRKLQRMRVLLFLSNGLMMDPHC